MRMSPGSLLSAFAVILGQGCVGDDGRDEGAACTAPPIGEVLTGVLADLNRDGVIEPTNGFDIEGQAITDRVLAGDGENDADTNSDGVPDTFDFDHDGDQDNRFYFNVTAEWIPDLDSFDDYEDPEAGIPRGETPLESHCAADGIETGPHDLGFDEYVPSSYCRRDDPKVRCTP
jgi:hypothetical protein